MHTGPVAGIRPHNRRVCIQVADFSASTANKYSVLQILIVDDEPLIRWSLAETFQQAGHAIREAGDARETLDMLNGGAYMPDVVLLDFRLPDSDDLRLLTSIRRMAPASTVIMMTAFHTPEMVAEAHRIGARAVLSKPVDMHALVPLVEQSHTPSDPAR
jgi:DNA-binding NtrC family response regulator